jgi:hypothetical protein
MNTYISENRTMLLSSPKKCATFARLNQLKLKVMETVSVDILNPSGLSLLKELEKLKLIAIHENEKTSVKSDDFMDLVRKIRKKSTAPLSLDEITAEVEQQRAEMYAVSE